MSTYIKIKWSKDLFGKDVSVLTHSGVEIWGFKARKVYKGKILDKVDWLVGCPVFENETGSLGVGYDCDIVEELS